MSGALDLAKLYAGEDEEQTSTTAQPGARRMASHDAPPPGRGPAGFVGLENQGATCYLNSLIQMMYMTPELRRGLFAVDPVHELGALQVEQAEEGHGGAGPGSTGAAGGGSSVVEGKPLPPGKYVPWDPTLMQCLTGMSFDTNGAQRAILASIVPDAGPDDPPTVDLQAAISWAVDHSNDHDFMSPLPQESLQRLKKPGGEASSTANGSKDSSPKSGAAAPSKRSKARVIPLEIQRLFSQLQLADRRTLATDDLTSKGFAWQSFDGRVQHDVHELVRLLIDALERSLVRTNGEKLMGSLFRGLYVYKVRCDECTTVSEREEPLYDLMLQVKSDSGAMLSDVDSSLHDMLRSEWLEGANKYDCEKCKKKTRAQRYMQLRSLPPVLVMNINRFDYDMKTLQRAKLTSKYQYPKSIDMAQFVEEHTKEQDSERLEYDLCGVIIHQGSAYSGHYHAYLRDCLREGKWSTPAPSSLPGPPPVVDIADLEGAADGSAGPEAQAINSIRLILQANNQPMSMNAVGQAVNKNTEGGWVNHYKPKLGALDAFIMRHPEYFALVGKDHVWLAELVGKAATNGASSTDRRRAQDTHTGVSASPSDGSSQGASQNVVLQSTAPPIPTHEEDVEWFDFDDSQVRPVTLHQVLNGPVQGRDSAYMLVYRRKDMKLDVAGAPGKAAKQRGSRDTHRHKHQQQQPQTPTTHPPPPPQPTTTSTTSTCDRPVVPEYWTQKIERDNGQLQRAREVHDREANLVRLRVLCPSDLRPDLPYFLTPVAGDDSGDGGGLLVEVDMRSDIEDVKQQIVSEFGGRARMNMERKVNDMETFTLHRLVLAESRPLVQGPNGTILQSVYLQPENGEVKDLKGAPPEMLVLAWDGWLIGDLSLKRDNLPVPIRVKVTRLPLPPTQNPPSIHTHTAQSDDTASRMLGLDKKLTLEELVASVSKFTNIDPSRLVLHWLKDMGVAPKAIPLYGGRSTDWKKNMQKPVHDLVNLDRPGVLEMFAEQAPPEGYGKQTLAELEVQRRNQNLCLTVVRGEAWEERRTIEIDGRKTLRELREALNVMDDEVVALWNPKLNGMTDLDSHYQAQDAIATSAAAFRHPDVVRADSLRELQIQNGATLVIKTAEQAAKFTLKFQVIQGNDTFPKMAEGKRGAVLGQELELEVDQSWTVTRVKEEMVARAQQAKRISPTDRISRRIRMTESGPLAAKGEPGALVTEVDAKGEPILVKDSPLMTKVPVRLEEGRVPAEGQVALKLYFWQPKVLPEPTLITQPSGLTDDKEIVDAELARRRSALVELPPVFATPSETLESFKARVLKEVLSTPAFTHLDPSVMFGLTDRLSVSFPARHQLVIRQIDESSCVPGAVLREHPAPWDHTTHTRATATSTSACVTGDDGSGSSGVGGDGDGCEGVGVGGCRTLEQLNMTGARPYVLQLRPCKQDQAKDKDPPMLVWAMRLHKPNGRQGHAEHTPVWPYKEVEVYSHTHTHAPTQDDDIDPALLDSHDLDPNTALDAKLNGNKLSKGEKRARVPTIQDVKHAIMRSVGLSANYNFEGVGSGVSDDDVDMQIDAGRYALARYQWSQHTWRIVDGGGQSSATATQNGHCRQGSEGGVAGQKATQQRDGSGEGALASISTKRVNVVRVLWGDKAEEAGEKDGESEGAGKKGGGGKRRGKKGKGKGGKGKGGGTRGATGNAVLVREGDVFGLLDLTELAAHAGLPPPPPLSSSSSSSSAAAAGSELLGAPLKPTDFDTEWSKAARRLMGKEGLGEHAKGGRKGQQSGAKSVGGKGGGRAYEPALRLGTQMNYDYDDGDGEEGDDDDDDNEQDPADEGPSLGE